MVRETGSDTPYVPGQDVLDSLLARYTFDNVSAPGEDISVNSRHGSIIGAGVVDDPERGRVLQFDGVDDYFSAPELATGVTLRL